MSLSNSNSDDIIKILNDTVTNIVLQDLLAGKFGSNTSNFVKPWDGVEPPLPRGIDLGPRGFDVRMNKCEHCDICKACLSRAAAAHDTEFLRRDKQIRDLEPYYAKEAAKCIASVLKQIASTNASFMRWLETGMENAWRVLQSIGDDLPGMEWIWEGIWRVLTQDNPGCGGCPFLTIPTPKFPITDADKELLKRCFEGGCNSRPEGGLFPPNFNWNDVDASVLLIYKFIYNEGLQGNGISGQPGLIAFMQIVFLYFGSIGLYAELLVCIDAAKSAHKDNIEFLKRILLYGPPHPSFTESDEYNRRRACLYLLPLCDSSSNGSVAN